LWRLTRRARTRHLGVRAFIATGKQGVTYKPNTWHHGLTVLDKPGRFAVFMWRDGTKGDEEFVPVEPFIIRIPDLETTMPYEVRRDFVGYGANPPNPKWPNGARLASTSS